MRLPTQYVVCWTGIDKRNIYKAPTMRAFSKTRQKQHLQSSDDESVFKNKAKTTKRKEKNQNKKKEKENKGQKGYIRYSMQDECMAPPTGTFAS